MSETVTDTPKMTDEEFKQRQDEEAAAQGLPPGAVADQRPQGTLKFPESQRSQGDLEREKNPESDRIAMGKDAYDRAAEAGQAKRAAKSHVLPSIQEGEVVRIIESDTDHFVGRVGVISGVHYTDQGQVDAGSGVRGLREFAEVESYIVTTRDEGNYRINVRPEQIEVVGQQNLVRTVR